MLERALGLLAGGGWARQHMRSSAQHTLDAFGNEVGRGTAVALAEALVPRYHVCT